jgi:hypothetical protein
LSIGSPSAVGKRTSQGSGTGRAAGEIQGLGARDIGLDRRPLGEGCSGARRSLAGSRDLDERVDCRPRNAERQPPSFLYDSVTQSWEAVQAGRELSVREVAVLRLACRRRCRRSI